MEKEILEKLEQLEKQNDELRHRMERAEAVTEIQNLMGKYYMMHVINPNPEFIGKTQWDSWQLWADRDDISVEIADWGLLVGKENVRYNYEKGRPDHNDPSTWVGPMCGKGTMFEHNITTPIIVVADDGQTARGVWTSPGHETTEFGPQWAWGRAAADFIKENGQWKIWHYHWYRVFRCPYDSNWVDFDMNTIARFKTLEDLRAQVPDPENAFGPSYFRPYRKDQYVEPVPFAPEPYATWTDDRFPV